MSWKLILIIVAFNSRDSTHTLVEVIPFDAYHLCEEAGEAMLQKFNTYYPPRGKIGHRYDVRRVIAEYQCIQTGADL